MRASSAIFVKQCKDSLHNLPTLMVAFIYPLVACLMTTAIGQEEGMNRMFIAMFATMHSVFTPMTIAGSILSEEKEKGTLRSLLMAGVSRVQYLCSTALFVFALTLLTGSSFLLMDTFTPQGTAGLLLCLAGGGMISTLAGLCVGIAAKNTAAANGMAVPVGLTLSLLPMLGQFNDKFSQAERLTYSGQISRVLQSGEMSVEMGAVCGMYAVSAAVLLVVLFRRKGLE